MSHSFFASKLWNTKIRNFGSNMTVLAPLLCLLPWAVTSFSPITRRPLTRQRHQVAKFYSLDSAFEWLADQRENEVKAYSNLDWIDIGSFNNNNEASTTGNEEEMESLSTFLPLYPLGATYVPSNSTHELNNFEPRNIQMILVSLAAECSHFERIVPNQCYRI